MYDATWQSDFYRINVVKAFSLKEPVDDCSFFRNYENYCNSFICKHSSTWWELCAKIHRANTTENKHIFVSRVYPAYLDTRTLSPSISLALCPSLSIFLALSVCLPIRVPPQTPTFLPPHSPLYMRC